MFLQPAYDQIINTKVPLQQGYHLRTAKVLQRSIGPNGTPAGQYSNNPESISITYTVEFPDGTVKQYSSNGIAERMLTPVNTDGFIIIMKHGITYHKVDTSTTVSTSDMYDVINRGQNKLRKTTCGWKFLIKQKDESESWIHLKDLKESHPIELAEYAKTRGI